MKPATLFYNLKLFSKRNQDKIFTKKIKSILSTKSYFEKFWQ